MAKEVFKVVNLKVFLKIQKEQQKWKNQIGSPRPRKESKGKGKYFLYDKKGH